VPIVLMLPDSPAPFFAREGNGMEHVDPIDEPLIRAAHYMHKSALHDAWKILCSGGNQYGTNVSFFGIIDERRIRFIREIFLLGVTRTKALSMTLRVVNPDSFIAQASGGRVSLPSICVTQLASSPATIAGSTGPGRHTHC
jgi:hypothetical protein